MHNHALHTERRALRFEVVAKFPSPGECERSPNEAHVFVNPYDPPTQSKPEPRKSTSLFAGASLVALFAFIIASPGLMYATSDMSRRMASGRRYATYDPELYLFGISITPTTAQILAFAVAPLMIALSVFLVFRGTRNRRLNTVSAACPD